jgi:hypothetical protein
MVEKTADEILEADTDSGQNEMPSGMTQDCYDKFLSLHKGKSKEWKKAVAFIIISMIISIIGSVYFSKFSLSNVVKLPGELGITISKSLKVMSTSEGAFRLSTIIVIVYVTIQLAGDTYPYIQWLASEEGEECSKLSESDGLDKSEFTTTRRIGMTMAIWLIVLLAITILAWAYAKFLIAKVPGGEALTQQIQAAKDYIDAIIQSIKTEGLQFGRRKSKRR